MFTELRESLEAGADSFSADLGDGPPWTAKELGLLTACSVLYVAKIDDAPPDLQRLGGIAGGRGRRESARVVPIAVRWELELAELGRASERVSAEISGSSRAGCPSWSKRRSICSAWSASTLWCTGSSGHGRFRRERAPVQDAAGRMHTDMQSGFIRARVFQVEELFEYPSLEALHQAGRIRTEGRDYLVQDGDVVEILFQAG